MQNVREFLNVEAAKLEAQARELRAMAAIPPIGAEQSVAVKAPRKPGRPAKPKPAAAPKPKRSGMSDLTKAKMRIGQAKRWGREPLAADVAFVAAAGGDPDVNVDASPEVGGRPGYVMLGADVAMPEVAAEE